MQAANEYWERWYSWIMHTSIDAMKDIATMMKAHLKSIMKYFTQIIINAMAERASTQR